MAIPIVQFIKSDTGAITSSNTVSLTNATTLAVNVTLASGYLLCKNRIRNMVDAARSTNAILLLHLLLLHLAQQQVH